MTIKLEKIYNAESEEVFYRIRKSFLKSMLLTKDELLKLKKLIIKETVYKN